MPRIHSRAIIRVMIVSFVYTGLFFVPLLLFISKSQAQQQEVRTSLTVDKARPVKPPSREKPKPSKAQSSRESTGPQPLTPLCGATFLVLLDDVKQVIIFAYNGPPNTTVNFTTVQTVSGILGLSPSATGPFVESIVVPVPLDGNGNGQSEIFYVQGVQLGNTTLYATSTEIGNTTSADYEVHPQCNCPPIPIVP